MQLALLWCCADPASSLPGPPTIFFQLHIHEIFYILSREQSKHSLRAPVIARAMSGRILKLTVFPPLKRGASYTQSNMFTFDVGVLTHVLPPPDLFTWTLRLPLHPRPLLATQQGQRLCHRCVLAGFCLRCGITGARKEATLLAN